MSTSMGKKIATLDGYIFNDPGAYVAQITCTISPLVFVIRKVLGTPGQIISTTGAYDCILE